MPPGARAPRRKPEPPPADPQGVDEPVDQPRSIRPVAVVVDPEELYALGLERRLYEVVRAFNELDVGQSLYLEPWAAQGFIDLGLIREVPDGQDQDPNRA